MPESKRYIPPPTIDRVYHFILWGDLSMAGLVHPMVITKKDTYEFYFIPTPTMRFKYQIQDSEYDSSRGCIIKEYPKDVCFSASDYPIGWIILNDYNSQQLDNNFIRKINNMILETNKELNREIIGYRILSSKQSYELIQILKHPEEARARQYAELKKVKDVVGTTQEIITPDDSQKPYEAGG